jgi:hypothetical protein
MQNNQRRNNENKPHKQQRHPIKQQSSNTRSPVQSNNIPVNKINQIISNKMYTPKAKKSTHVKQETNIECGALVE